MIIFSTTAFKQTAFRNLLLYVVFTTDYVVMLLSRSNLMGTKFTVFDNALNPERALPDLSNARQEMAGVIYVRPYRDPTIWPHVAQEVERVGW